MPTKLNGWNMISEGFSTVTTATVNPRYTLPLTNIRILRKTESNFDWSLAYPGAAHPVDVQISGRARAMNPSKAFPFASTLCTFKVNLPVVYDSLTDGVNTTTDGWVPVTIAFSLPNEALSFTGTAAFAEILQAAIGAVVTDDAQILKTVFDGFMPR